ncbi:hypothetical protein OIV83_001480 [Microbotryomycetes sp. JL201]|nr:hypothetical protein OIV83_001480 [Microbotryomycetes sp. JL201]
MSHSFLVPNTPSQSTARDAGDDHDDSYGDSYLQDMLGGPESIHSPSRKAQHGRQDAVGASALATNHAAVQVMDRSESDDTSRIDSEGPGSDAVPITVDDRFLDGSVGHTQFAHATATHPTTRPSQPANPKSVASGEIRAQDHAATIPDPSTYKDPSAPQANPAPGTSDPQPIVEAGEAQKENSPPDVVPGMPSAPLSSLVSQYHSEDVSSSPTVARNLLGRDHLPGTDVDSAPLEGEKLPEAMQGPLSDPVPSIGMNRHANRLGPQMSTPAFTAKHLPPIQPALTIQQLMRSEQARQSATDKGAAVSPTKRKATYQSSDVMVHPAAKPKRKRRNSWGTSSTPDNDSQNIENNASNEQEREHQGLADESGEAGETQATQRTEEEESQPLMVDRMPEPLRLEDVANGPAEKIPEPSIPPTEVVPTSDAVTEISLPSDSADPMRPTGSSVRMTQTQPSQDGDSNIRLNLTDIGMMDSSQAYASQFEMDPTQIVHDVERVLPGSVNAERDLPEFQYETAASTSGLSRKIFLGPAPSHTAFNSPQRGTRLKEPLSTVLESQPQSVRFETMNRLEAIDEGASSGPSTSLGAGSGGFVPDSQASPRFPRRNLPASSSLPQTEALMAGVSSSAALFATTAVAQPNPRRTNPKIDVKGKEKVQSIAESESVDELDLIGGASRRNDARTAEADADAGQDNNSDIVELPTMMDSPRKRPTRQAKAKAVSAKASKVRKLGVKAIGAIKCATEGYVRKAGTRASGKNASKSKANSSKATSVASETEAEDDRKDEDFEETSRKASSSKRGRSSTARSRIPSVSDEGSTRPGSKSKLPEGAPFSRVMALWRDDGWMYPATITSVLGGFARVRFEDGATGKLRFTELRRCELRCGDLIYRTQGPDNRPYADFEVLRCEKAGTGEVTAESLQSDDEIIAELAEAAADEHEELISRIKVADICIRPAHVVLLDDRRLTPREIAAFEGRTGPPAAKPLPLLDVPPPVELEAATINRRGGLFARTAFLMTNVVEDRAAIQAMLTDKGGSVIDVEHFMRVTVPSKGHEVQVAFAQQAFKDVDTILLLADRPSTTPKYLIALALGIPCVCSKYILESVRENVRLDWRDFAMSSGSVQALGTFVVGAQMRSINKTAFDLASLATFRQSYGLFRGRSVVLTIIAAAGAVKVDFVAKPEAASDATAYDHVVLDDGQSKPSSLATHPGVGSLTWLKQCLIAGRVLQPALLKPSTN